MPQPTHTITQTHPPGRGKAKSFSYAQNAGPWSLVPDARSVSGKMVKIYSVVAMLDLGEINRAAPYSRVRLPICKEGQKVSDPYLIPPFVSIPMSKLGSYEVHTTFSDGREVAADIVNPALGPNWRLDNCQDIVLTDESWNALSNVNNNFNEWGVFWTDLEPSGWSARYSSEKSPEGRYELIAELKEQDKLQPLIEKFKARAVKTLSRYARNAQQKEAGGKIAEINHREYFAANYLGVRLNSSAALEHMISCPNCGEPVKSGVSYHRNSFGDKCVLDWKKAYGQGAVKKDDVPPEFIWWEAKK
jgi:hypothetical protein